MSMFSGKCDLYDHIMLEKTYDMGGYCASDELECFEIFKGRTGGVIYQNRAITVSEDNLDYVKNHCYGFEYSCINIQKEDKRYKSGFKNTKQYTFSYRGKEFSSLADLNKEHIVVQFEIKFDTLLDIVPYYPYLVSSCVRDQDHEVVIITQQSYVDRRVDEQLAFGSIPTTMAAYYKKQLQDHYLAVCKNYFLYNYEKRVHTEPIVVDANTGIGETSKDIDPMHELTFVWKDARRNGHYWSAPAYIEGNKYRISDHDLRFYLTKSIKNDEVFIQYVEKCDIPKTLS